MKLIENAVRGNIQVRLRLRLRACGKEGGREGASEQGNDERRAVGDGVCLRGGPCY